MGTLDGDIEENQSYLDDLIDRIRENWRPAFERFVETGEAEAAFLDYLNEDLTAQEAVETAFNRQAARFEDLAAELKRADPTTRTGEYKVAAPEKVAAAVQVALETPSARREEVMETSTAEIAASTPAEERIVLKEFAKSLEHNLAKVADATRS